MSEALPPPTEPTAADRSWRLWASVFVGAFTLISLILALIVMPSRSETRFDPFAAICRALGIPGYAKIPPDPGAATASAPVSNVAWTVETRRLLSNASATRGATVAKDTCGVCHGEDGKSVDPAQFPNLAGQSEAAIFKELRDFQSGDRKSDIMQPLAASLTEQQISDVAAYYATQPRADLRAADSGVFAQDKHFGADRRPRARDSILRFLPWVKPEWSRGRSSPPRPIQSLPRTTAQEFWDWRTPQRLFQAHANHRATTDA